MYDITPADIVPFVAAIVAGLAAMLFGRHREDARPYSLVSAILYAIALGCVILGLVSWGTRLMH
jgi:tellurite resistance protein TehA-like permease